MITPAGHQEQAKSTQSAVNEGLTQNRRKQNAHQDRYFEKSTVEYQNENIKKMEPSRISRFIIYPKDVAIIYGFSEKSARTLMHKIKRKIGKEAYQPLTLSEFCTYTGMKEAEVVAIIMP